MGESENIMVFSVYLHTDICYHVSVLNGAGLVQIAPDRETLVVENHHAHHVRSVLQHNSGTELFDIIGLFVIKPSL